jgi:hypothetical protein
VRGPAGGIQATSEATRNEPQAATKQLGRRHLNLVWSQPGCRWEARCHGAVSIRAHFTILGIWSTASWAALDLPKPGRRYPCHDCPITRIGWGLVA